MAKYCDICGKKLGFLLKEEVKDGMVCFNCYRPLSHGIDQLESEKKYLFHASAFTIEQFKQAREFPETAVNIVREVYGRLENIEDNTDFLMEINRACVLCGQTVGLEEKTSDDKKVCWQCANPAITIEPQKYMELKKKAYIRSCSSEYLKEKMKDWEYAHDFLAINYTTGRCYDTRTGFSLNMVKNVYDFDSITKLEMELKEFVVGISTEGKRIAREIENVKIVTLGKGAQQAGNTPVTKKYINIYYKDPENAENNIKREYICNSNEEFMKLKKALKRIFEFEKIKKVENEKKTLS